VAQDEGNESASVLVKKIKAEKEMRVEEGNIKKSKQLPLIKNTEIPYEVPDGWTWVRLNDITNIGTGSTPLKSNHKYYEDGSIPWITSSLTSQRYIDAPDIFITQLAVKEYRLKKYPPDTLIIALYGQGKTRGQVSELKIEATINQACAAIVFIEPFEDIKNYVRLVLEKKYDELRSLAEGGAQPNLNVGKIKETLIPVPPLKEQKRIVAKVDQLMTLCDELEAGLVQAQTDGGKLMEAVVHHVLAE
jgi:type I restriction enzyme, S subunit